MTRILFSILVGLVLAIVVALAVQVSAIARLLMFVRPLRPIASPLYRGCVSFVMFAIGAVKR